jgi:hypothetical protein
LGRVALFGLGFVALGESAVALLMVGQQRRLIGLGYPARLHAPEPPLLCYAPLFLEVLSDSVGDVAGGLAYINDPTLLVGNLVHPREGVAPPNRGEELDAAPARSQAHGF